MPTKKVVPIKPLTSWSVSRYNVYAACPAKARFKFIDKLAEPSSPAMERGSAIHKLAELYLKGDLKKLPKELELFKDDFKALKTQKVKFIEEDWAFKSNWQQTTWNNWAECWLRVKTDAAYIDIASNVLVIIDFKTGKYSNYKLGEYQQQLELYALAGLKRFPTVSEVNPKLWYLDYGVVHPVADKVYLRSEESYLEKLWSDRVKKMLTDKVYKPTPGNACTYCYFKKANDGPCSY